MHQHMVPMVPRTLAEVGMEVWGGMGLNFGCVGRGREREDACFGFCL